MRRERRRGLAIVEAAIVLPLILLLTFGMMEYGLLLVRQQDLTNIVRYAARAACVHRADRAAIMTKANEMVAQAHLGGAVTVTIPEDLGSIPPGTSFEVKATVPYASVTRFSGIPSIVPAILVPEQLHASVIMVKEGPMPAGT